MKALFLGFDGVIVDSREENYLVSSAVYFGFSKKEYSDTLLKALFFKYYRLTLKQGDSLPLMKALERFVADNSKESDDCIREYFEEEKKNLPTTERELFECLLYQYRHFIKRDAESWLELHSLTDFGKSLQGAQNLDRISIVTAKDKASVKALLSEYAIPITRIFDADELKIAGSKARLISTFMDQHIEYTSADFVDDQLAHLDQVFDERVSCFVADVADTTDQTRYPAIDY